MADDINDILVGTAPTAQAAQAPVPETPATPPAAPAAPAQATTQPAAPSTAAQTETNFLEQLITESFPGQQQPASQPPGPQQANGRDYSGFDDSERTMFSQMSNDAFRALAPIYRGTKDGTYVKKDAHERAIAEARAAAGKPVFAYDHEAGYVLHPDYQKMYNATVMEQNDLDYAKKQLSLAKAGKPFRWFQRDQNGNFVQDQQLSDATPENMAQVSMWIDDTDRIVRDNMRQLESFKAGHVQAHGQYKSLFKAMEQTLSPYMANSGFKAEVEKILGQMVPAQFRGDPKDMIIAQQAVLLNLVMRKQKQAGAVTQAAANGGTLRGTVAQSMAGGSTANALDAVNEALLGLR